MEVASLLDVRSTTYERLTNAYGLDMAERGRGVFWCLDMQLHPVISFVRLKCMQAWQARVGCERGMRELNARSSLPGNYGRPLSDGLRTPSRISCSELE